MELLAARQSSRFSEDADVTRQSLLKKTLMSIETMLLILLILLILLLIGAIPACPHCRSWGYGPSGGLSLMLLIVVFLLLLLLGRP